MLMALRNDTSMSSEQPRTGAPDFIMPPFIFYFIIESTDGRYNVFMSSGEAKKILKIFMI